MLSRSRSYLLVIAFSCHIITPDSITKKLISILEPRYYEHNEHFEYPLKKDSSLVIRNENGSVTIKTEWNKDKLVIHTTKKTRSPEKNTFIKINTQKFATNHLCIQTEYTENTPLYEVDYTLIVPPRCKVTIENDNGDIRCYNTTGRITATTKKNGCIEAHNTTGVIRAHTNKGPIKIVNPKNIVEAKTISGAITIDNPYELVQASTINGPIKISHAKKNTLASTKKGKINVMYDHPICATTINLTTKSGTILLGLPENVHASLSAETKKGIFQSEIPIVFENLETKINKLALQSLQKHIKGKIGSKKDPQTAITLLSEKSSIKVTHNQSPDITKLIL